MAKQIGSNKLFPSRYGKVGIAIFLLVIFIIAIIGYFYVQSEKENYSKIELSDTAAPIPPQAPIHKLMNTSSGGGGGGG
jgi:hypothetical protein